MKYVKMLGLAAVAAAALMAFVGASNASADVLCTTTTTPCEVGKRVSSLHAVNVGNVKLTTTFKNIECTGSTVQGSVTSDGGAGVPIEGSVETLTFTGCNCTVTVLEKGTLKATQIGGTDNGTVSSSGASVTASCNTIIGTVHCIYNTNSTHLGVVTGGHDAILHVEEAEIPRAVTSAACAEKAKWDATYTVTNHTEVYVESN